MKEKVKKVVKLEFFLKGIVHGFGQNLKFFPVCILVKIGVENALDDILERVKAFLDYENTMLKKVEKLGFFQRG